MGREDKAVFFPNGTFFMYAEKPSTSGTGIKKEIKAAETARSNTPDYLRSHLINIPSIYRKDFPNGLVQTFTPTKPYSYGGIMVVAAKDYLIDEASDVPLSKSGRVNTETIYEYPEELQTEYYRQVIAGLFAQETVPLPGNSTQWPAVACENTAIKVSDEEHKIARSIAIPHTQIIKFGDWIDNAHPAPSFTHLHAEQSFIRQDIVFDGFMDRFQKNLQASEAEPNVVGLLHRKEAPVGYTVTTSLTSTDSLDVLAKGLRSIMSFNHAVYGQHAQALIGEHNVKRENFTNSRGERRDPSDIKDVAESIIPQPSYRSYIYFDNTGELKVSISPILFSPSGVIEAGNIYFDRGPDYPHPFTPEQQLQHSFAVQEALVRLLKNT